MKWTLCTFFTLCTFCTPVGAAPVAVFDAQGIVFTLDYGTGVASVPVDIFGAERTLLAPFDVNAVAFGDIPDQLSGSIAVVTAELRNAVVAFDFVRHTKITSAYQLLAPGPLPYYEWVHSDQWVATPIRVPEPGGLLVIPALAVLIWACFRRDQPPPAK